MIVTTNSAQDTIALGKKFFSALNSQDIIVLEGDLGGGKTTFIKGVLGGFGYRKRVLSPSFTLVRQYKIKNKFVYHIDLYRLQRKDCLGLGIEDLIYSKDSLTLIEWGDKIRDDLDKYIDIKFIFLGENKRKLIFSTKGYGKDKLQLIRKAFKNEVIRV
jgi:tRNA threonylcarbamoyladenosine biosynthesis protein TsaE